MDLFAEEQFNNKVIKPQVGSLAVICKPMRHILYPPRNFWPRCVLVLLMALLCGSDPRKRVSSQVRCRLISANVSLLS